MPFASIGWGIVSGAGYALKGYWSKTGKKDSEFDWIKFAKTVIIGGVVGGVASQFGLTFEATEMTLTGIGILTMIDVGITAFINKGWKWLKDKF